MKLEVKKIDGDDSLSKILNVIVASSHPDKVILFGSRACGQFRKTSDYDFLIVKKNVSNERKVSRQVYRALFNENIDEPVDVIVVDKKKWESVKLNPYLIYSWALKEGKVIYG